MDLVSTENTRYCGHEDWGGGSPPSISNIQGSAVTKDPGNGLRSVCAFHRLSQRLIDRLINQIVDRSVDESQSEVWEGGSPVTHTGRVYERKAFLEWPGHALVEAWARCCSEPLKLRLILWIIDEAGPVEGTPGFQHYITELTSSCKSCVIWPIQLVFTATQRTSSCKYQKVNAHDQTLPDHSELFVAFLKSLYRPSIPSVESSLWSEFLPKLWWELKSGWFISMIKARSVESLLVTFLLEPAKTLKKHFFFAEPIF